MRNDGVSVVGIYPKPIDIQKMYDALVKGWDEMVSAPILKDLESTSSKWKGERPRWKRLLKIGIKQISVTFVPANPTSKGALKWFWLNDGTRDHDIDPKSGNTSGLLRFQTNYTAGSSPGTLYTTAGGATGPFVFARHTRVRGIKPRKWSQTIAKYRQAYVNKHAGAIFARVAAVSGHAIKR